MRPYLKNNLQLNGVAGGMTQAAECFPSNYETLSLNPITTGERGEKERKRERGTECNKVVPKDFCIPFQKIKEVLISSVDRYVDIK
jgi:hypothetical protein